MYALVLPMAVISQMSLPLKQKLCLAAVFGCGIMYECDVVDDIERRLRRYGMKMYKTVYTVHTPQLDIVSSSFLGASSVMAADVMRTHWEFQVFNHKARDMTG